MWQTCPWIPSLRPLSELGFIESWIFALFNNTNNSCPLSPRLLEYDAPFPEPFLLSFHAVSVFPLTSWTSVCFPPACITSPHFWSRPGYRLCVDTLDLFPACSVSWAPYIRLTTGHHLSIPLTAQNCSVPGQLTATLCSPASVFYLRG